MPGPGPKQKGLHDTRPESGAGLIISNNIVSGSSLTIFRGIMVVQNLKTCLRSHQLCPYALAECACCCSFCRVSFTFWG